MRLRLTLIYGALFLAAGVSLLAITYVLVDRATSDTSTITLQSGEVVTMNGTPDVPPAASPGGKSQADDNGTVGSADQAAPPTIENYRALAARQHNDQMHQLLVQSGLALAMMSVLSVGLGWIVAGRVLRPLRTITSAAREMSTTSLHLRLALEGPEDELKVLGDTFDDLLDRLEAAFESQRRFIANASHELRTPLTVIRALLQMALSDPHATLESVRLTCAEAILAGDDQERLIEALLVLARSERGLDQRDQFDLAMVVDDVLLSRHTEIERHGLELHSALHTAPVEGDQRLAERLIVNLIENAIHHNINTGRINVTVASVRDRAVLTVDNSGPLLAPEEISRLYEPFQRFNTSTTQNADGLGLGLAIVKAIVDAHGATIVTEALPAGGLRIVVEFPRPSRPAESDGNAMSSRPTQNPPDTPASHILDALSGNARS